LSDQPGILRFRRPRFCFRQVLSPARHNERLPLARSLNNLLAVPSILSSRCYRPPGLLLPNLRAHPPGSEPLYLSPFLFESVSWLTGLLCAFYQQSSALFTRAPHGHMSRCLAGAPVSIPLLRRGGGCQDRSGPPPVWIFMHLDQRGTGAFHAERNF